MVANFVAGGAAINVLARRPEPRSPSSTSAWPPTSLALGLAASDGLRLRRVRARHRQPGHRARHVRGGRRGGTRRGRRRSPPTWWPTGARALITGEMGIGNTTAAAAVIAALHRQPRRRASPAAAPASTTRAWPRKIAVVERALARTVGPAPIRSTVLAEVGGLEIAALAGFIVGGASHRVPVLVDGVITGAALLAAQR